MIKNDNTKYMQIALKMAQIAYQKGEVPIGAVLVKDGKILAKAYNKRQTSRVATNHAEVLAITKACKKIGDWRLCDCDMYVTAIPCPMCAGAIVNARIKNVYYGADNENTELCKQIFLQSSLNHKTNLCSPILQEECSALLTKFFKEKRQNSKTEHKDANCE